MKKRNLALLGFLAGLTNGFFGSAGGIIIVQGLLKMGIEDKKAHATALTVILPLSIISAIIYALRGFDVTSFLPLGAGALLGGALGAIFLKKAAPELIDWTFTIIILACGVRMLL